MVKKQTFDFKKWLWIGGLPAALTAIGFLAVNLAVYIKLPERVASAEEKVETIEDYIKEQRIANDLLKEMVQQNQQYQQKKQPYCEYGLMGQIDVLWCWDEQNQNWYQGG